jgi:hypothetical protein
MELEELEEAEMRFTVTREGGTTYTMAVPVYKAGLDMEGVEGVEGAEGAQGAGEEDGEAPCAALPGCCPEGMLRAALPAPRCLRRWPASPRGGLAHAAAAGPPPRWPTHPPTHHPSPAPPRPQASGLPTRTTMAARRRGRRRGRGERA